ncbi:Sarcosine oxidase gamma subunit [Aequoribacter fuscus]|uniref:Sarcosine oxidase gamma subunit n=1 Tax=Aequoribacter fuscus TaxID=2518989 RepID=F3KY73_9GAMM|nr:sarcosine oxidase subunit gamma family protein [Aequoribacter fuscus]EGG30929.1 Sarcosine oxidase gamma subunit [Aequoribacter fuscus]QHJ89295.1 sarcosine oxidase subunit gamma [Aequoribacter fuscus]
MSEARSPVAIMNQVPEASANVRGESPLHHVDLANMASLSTRGAGVIFQELGLQGHLTLRCQPDDAQLTNIAQRILGVALPLRPLTSVEGADVVIRWIAPDEWLISLPNDKVFELETRFRAEMTGHYSLVNGSGGMTVFILSGEHVVDVLKKSTPIDVHESVFPVGKVVSTVFAKSSAVVRRLGPQEFELVVRRSFADYLWLWLQSASQEFGLAIADAGTSTPQRQF